MCTGTWRVEKYHPYNSLLNKNENMVFFSLNEKFKCLVEQPPLWQSHQGCGCFHFISSADRLYPAKSPTRSPAAGEAARKLAGDGVLSVGDLCCSFYFVFVFSLNPCGASAPLLSEAVSLTHRATIVLADQMFLTQICSER